MSKKRLIAYVLTASTVSSAVKFMIFLATDFWHFVHRLLPPAS